MKVVFVADLKNPSTSGRQRLWALKQCGIDVSVITTEDYPSVFGKWAYYIARIFKRPRLMRNARLLEQAILDISKQVKPEIIWLEWPRQLSINLINELKKIEPRPFLISFQDDNPWGKRTNDLWLWREYLKIVPLFDLHLVKRESDIVHLSALGAKACRLWRHGIYSPIFHPSIEPVEIEYPVSFVGTCMDGREKLIGFLLENKIPIHVFGHHWNRRSDLPQRFPANFHPPVEGENYAEVIRKSQICIGLVSHSNLDEWTMRTYEVPGCARLLLAERTPYHQLLFVENEDAILFSNIEECRKILMGLLSDKNRCLAMGRVAYERFTNHHYKLEDSMQELLDFLKQTL
ncbi:spore maturation protein CgeB [Mucilaginibacter gracilis]|uniref:Spore maturation protein CgeB n=1 Tax=Mucilaginibacter gracilis TaxID=423350 RepID=A0A495J1R5_9SPHI|nr:glycosyltransferase [Mucilaginibacter gracilis]RKR82254.1 spore maturation protein CgeB [Mucilaginibacter gracilis]